MTNRVKTTQDQTNQVSKLKKSVIRTLQLSTAISFAFSSFAMAVEEIALDTVEVVGKRVSDTKPVKGYNAKKSSASTKTDTPLINVPQAITVITQDVIKDQSALSISDVVRYVPGVMASQGEGNRDALVFRGNRTTSDIFLDGMRDDIQMFRDLYNTDRVEVLKGPNGMIFGRGGAGGVINRVTKKAGWDPVEDVSLTYGAWDQKRFTGDFGQALTDNVAFRINAVYEDSDSFRDGVNLERYGVAPTFTFNLSEQTSINLSAEYFKDQRIGDRGIPSVDNATGDNRRPFNLRKNQDKFFGNARLSPNEAETKSFNVSIDHTFDNNVKIKNSTRYTDYDKFYQNIYASGSVTAANTVKLSGYRDEVDRKNLINQTDVTIPFDWGTTKHTVLAGIELVDQDNEQARFVSQPGTTSSSIAGAGAVDVNNPTVNASFSRSNLAKGQDTQISSQGYYIQDQVEFNDQWQVIAGLRRDIFETDYKNVRPGDEASVDTTDAFWSPRAGLIFKPTNNTSLYASYSISYAPRTGDQLQGLRNIETNPDLFDPEKFINKEVGVKWDINPNLSFTAATYLLERENLVANDPNEAGISTLLDGQETQGVELSLAGNVTDKWSVIAAYTYQDGELTKDQGAPGAITAEKGAELGETPDHLFSLWNKYKINNVWSVALGVVGRSEMYAATEQVTGNTLIPGYTRYDAAIFAKLSEKATLQLNVENLTNKDYIASSHNNNNLLPGAPVSVRATLNYSF
ncbi:MAG: catecholate siderophore receptor [Methylophilaceae bacterium]|jgi:catecholate siderophore receptor